MTSPPTSFSHPKSKKQLERVMGIEPTSKAWEALVLPLNYTRTIANRHCADHQPIVNANPKEPYPANGINFDATSVTTNPSADTRVSITLNDFSVSFSVKPLNRDTTQKPLSFIQEAENAANPIAK